MKPVSILLVDDNEQFLRAAAHFAATIPAVSLSGCGQLAVALKWAVHNMPDLILLDFHTCASAPQRDTCQYFKQMSPTSHLVLVAPFGDEAYEECALQLGADGLIVKYEFGIQLLSLIDEWQRNEFGCESPDEVAYSKKRGP